MGTLNLKKVINLDQGFEIINSTIKKALESEEIEIKLNDIAIIYPSIGYSSRHIDNEIRDLNYVYQKHTSRSPIDRSNNIINVLSSRYCKGLDYKLVFLIHFEELNISKDDYQESKEAENLYVALTRTTNYAFIISSKPSVLIDVLFEENVDNINMT